MKIFLKYFVVSLFVQLLYINNVYAELAAPELSLSTKDYEVRVLWDKVPNAKGYRLYYAPYPDQSPIESIDMGKARHFSAELWKGAAFYVAITAYSGSDESDFSNIKHFILQNGENDASFYPIFSKNKSGALQKNYWVYKINDGKPQIINDSGMELRMSFNDLRVELDPKRSEKSAFFDGTFSGSATGDFNTEVSQSLAFSNQTTLVDDQDIAIEMNMSVSGISLNIDIELNYELYSSSEWFLDRNNLDTLPIGYIHNESGQIDGYLSGNVSVSSSGFSNSSPINESVKSADSWEIIDKLKSIRVQGKKYSNIVLVKRTTVSPSVSTGGALASDSVEMLYWVAKGIGMVKGTGQYNFSGEELSIELVDSNLLP